ncbi:chemotaxis sensory transducer [Desulfurispirillum indicum S5]|uniref:Chemotaxis sensory transducer n=1 Tax=Desulfurispirillum indicum (strain ATCC BAA-1389 / DSM 22839 / S5) TaxID=653733 RepID=E6W6L2_DESIS|nr:methyl-accepting chemotaxis protein [Desulfurispirillum indicum]ADU65012.1 chemotaxis sensory transducer [Desulfurispirillum indicum S5]
MKFTRTIKGRLILFLGLAAMGTAILVAIALNALYTSLHNAKEAAVQEITESLHSVVADFWQMSREGLISDEQARASALRALKAVRYGDNDYFWVNDMQPRMIMHPTNPKLDGQDLSGFEDPNGKRLFVEFVRTVRENGKGHVNYLWPKPGFTNPVQKTSYVMGFEPWGWIIGTGVYIDDIQGLFWAQVRNIAVTVGVLILILMVPMFFILRSIILSSSSIARVAEDLASGEGDLTKRIPITGEDELSQAAKFVNRFLDKVQAIIIDVREVSHGVASASEQLSSSSSQMSAAMNMQAENVSKIASASLEMSQTVNGMTTNAGEIKENASLALQAAREGGAVIRRSAGEMESIVEQVNTAADFATTLEENASRVEQVIQVINDIADQTNLLALNAAIEAARAGDAGRGFAVVADEVRKLAERSTQSTSEIIDIVKSIQGGINQMTSAMGLVNEKVNQGSQLSRDADKSFVVILENIQTLQQLIEHNVGAMEEMFRTSEQVSDDIQSISSSTEESAKVSEEVALAASDLARLAGEVQRHLGGFIVDDRSQQKMLAPR